MPVMPTYTPRIQSPDTGSAARVDTGADAIAQGARALGAGIQQFGAGVDAYQRKQEQQEEFDLDQKRGLYRQQTQTAYQSALQAAPANGQGFAGAFMAGQDKRDAEFMKTVPDRLKSRYQGYIASDREQVFRTATGAEDSLKGKWNDSQINLGIEDGQRQAFNDPSRREAVLADAERAIDLAPGLTPQEKELKKIAARREIDRGFAMGEIRARQRAPVAPTGQYKTSVVYSGAPDMSGLSPSAQAMLGGMVRSGAVPELKIRSAFRDAARNAGAGGAKHSQHIHGNALDLDIAGKSDEEKAAILQSAIDNGARGVGIYPSGNSLHIDTRASPTVWGFAPNTHAALSPEETLAKAPAWAKPALTKLYGIGGSAADTTGAVPVTMPAAGGNYFQLIRQHESGGDDGAQAKTSTATGRYQFIESTWNALAQKHPDLGLTPQNRMDPAAQERAIRAFTADNAAALQAAGIQPTNGNLYMAHFLGAGAATKFIKAMEANPNQSAAALFPDAAAANSGVFYSGGRAGTLAAVYARQTKMFGAAAGAPVPATQSDGTQSWLMSDDPRLKGLTFEDRMGLVNWSRQEESQGRSIAKGQLEPLLADATSAYLTTGRYTGTPVTREMFNRAYGPEEGAQRYAQFVRVQDIGQKVDAFKTMTPEQIAATVSAAKPVDAGEGFAAQQAAYETLLKAQAATAEARKDSGRYIRSVFPEVNRLWEGAGTPEGYRAAVTATAEAAKQIGMAPQDVKLLPDDMAKKVVDAFKREDATPQQRIAGALDRVLSAGDKAQQQAVFRQLVDAGLPAEMTAVLDAYSERRTGAGDFLARAIMSDPSKLPLKSEVTPAAIRDEITGSYKQTLDAAYGITLGRPENLARAQQGGDVMVKAVQLRIAQGMELSGAVKQTMDDMFGRDRELITSTGDGARASIILRNGEDRQAIRYALDKARPALVAGLEAQRLAHLESIKERGPQAVAVEAASAENMARLTLAGGTWVNLNDGYAFIDPYTNQAVPGPDGKPLIVRVDPGQRTTTLGARDPVAADRTADQMKAWSAGQDDAQAWKELEQKGWKLN